MEPERFSFSARGMIPRWFLVLWDCLTLLIVGVAIAQLRLHPAIIVFLVYGGVFIATTRAILWMLSNPKWNFIELKIDSLLIVWGHPPLWRGWHTAIPYSNVEGIRENAMHSYWPVWVWPHKPVPSHIDVGLRRAVTVPGWRLGWFNVLHLDVSDPLRFVAELRLAARPWVRL